MGAWVSLFCTSRRLIRRKRTVTNQGQYFTINSRISEYDHKCETRNAEPEIGTDRSSQTRRNPRVDGYGSRFGPPRVCGSGFWPVLEPNRPVFAVQTRTAGGLPGPVANTSQGAPRITKMMVMKAKIVMQSAPPASNDGPQRNSWGLTWEPVMSTGKRARMATMWMRMWMRRKSYCKWMMHQRRIWRTDLGPSDADGYEGKDGDAADADEEEEASHSEAGSTQNVEDWGHCTRECEDRAVYFRPV